MIRNGKNALVTIHDFEIKEALQNERSSSTSVFFLKLFGCPKAQKIFAQIFEVDESKEKKGTI